MPNILELIVPSVDMSNRRSFSSRMISCFCFAIFIQPSRQAWFESHVSSSIHLPVLKVCSIATVETGVTSIYFAIFAKIENVVMYRAHHSKIGNSILVAITKLKRFVRYISSSEFELEDPLDLFWLYNNSFSSFKFYPC